MWDEFFDIEALEDAADEQERVLVVVVPSAQDWERVQNEHWYRIPVRRAPPRIGARYLAFYHTAACGEDLRWRVCYYAAVQGYRVVSRRALLPDEPDHPRADDLYFRVALGPLVALPRPIPSHSLRRVTFIATTLGALLGATEINDLWDRETARDRLRVIQRKRVPTTASASLPAHAAAAAHRAGHDDQEIGSQARDRTFHLRLRTRTQRHHRHNRGDADDHTQHRQQAAQQQHGRQLRASGTSDNSRSGPICSTPSNRHRSALAMLGTPTSSTAAIGPPSRIGAT